MAVYLVSFDLHTSNTDKREDDYKKLEKLVTDLSNSNAIRVLKSQFLMVSKLQVAEVSARLDSGLPFRLGDGLLVVEVHSDTMASNLPVTEKNRIQRLF